MLNIGEFLNRIKSARAKQFLVRDVVRDSIQKISGVIIPAEAVLIRSSTAELKNVNQADRSTIFIKKQRIIEDINSNQTLKKIDDIR
jgi:hypothetical protein